MWSAKIRVWRYNSVTEQLPRWSAISPQKRNVGFVFQHYAAFKHMTVRDNIAFGLKVRQAGHKPRSASGSTSFSKLVRLDGLGHRYPAQLSGGQRQRMGLARALAPRAEGAAPRRAVRGSRREGPGRAAQMAPQLHDERPRDERCSSRTTRRRRWRRRHDRRHEPRRTSSRSARQVSCTTSLRPSSSCASSVRREPLGGDAGCDPTTSRISRGTRGRGLDRGRSSSASSSRLREPGRARDGDGTLLSAQLFRDRRCRAELEQGEIVWVAPEHETVFAPRERLNPSAQGQRARLATSASVVCSSTPRIAARDSIQTSRRAAADPVYSTSSGRTPRTVAIGP